MQVEIIQDGRVLKTYRHKGQVYAEVPETGPYQIRVRNRSHKRKLVVVSVDGVNVVNGEDAGFDGDGYVLRPYETLDIPGFRRDDGTVAAFTMEEKENSYAAQTGRGTSNVGVIGVAVFDEKVQTQAPFIIRQDHYHYPPSSPWNGWPPRIGSPFQKGDWSYTYSTNSDADSLELCNSHTETVCSTAGDDGVPNMTYCSDVGVAGGQVNSASIKDVGTAYGEEVEFHTMDVEFERATDKPNRIFDIRYATRERLREWGVPVDRKPPKSAPNPFPASVGASVPPPPGWEG